DRTRVGLERPSDALGHADGLLYERLQLVKDRSCPVRPVVLLIADPLDGHETASLQLRQLAIHGAHAGAYLAYDLRSVEAALRVAEDQRQHPLLNPREQRV